MGLLKLQEKFINLLKNDLNNSSINKKAYYIKGNQCCGKTYLLNYIDDLFNGDKNVKIIKFFSNNEETKPYECLEKYDFFKNNKFNCDVSINACFLNFNIFQLKKYIEGLKNNKNYIINKIKKQLKNKTGIILIDNIQNLHMITKKLIEDIFNSVNLKYKNIFIIFTSNSFENININYEDYKLELTKDDLERIINPQIIKNFKQNELLKLIDNNIPLMKIINESINIDEKNLNLENLLEKFISVKLAKIKINILDDKYIDIRNFLQEISILNNNILKEDFEIIDKKDKIDYYLDVSKQLNFIEEIKNTEKEYYFYEVIKQYYYNNLKLKKQELYERLDNYFKLTTPENYLKRAKYLIDSNNEQLIKKGLYLNLLDYTNKYKSKKILAQNELYQNNETYENNKIYEIEKKYKTIFYNDKQNYEKAIDNIFENNFKEAINNLNVISIDNNFNIAFVLEVLRNKVLCYYMLRNNEKLLKVSEILYSKIINHKENEDDQLCKSIILLIGIFANNLNDKNKVDQLKIQFNNIIDKHIISEYFEYFKIEFDRRSSIFESLHTCKIKLKNCVLFFENNNGYIFETYYTLVNYVSICLVWCDFYEFDKYTKKCHKLEQKYYFLNLGKEQKLNNNKILKEYLQKEQSLQNKKDKNLLIYARKALVKLNEIKSNAKNISKVVDFNIINFCLLLNELDKAEKFLNDLELEIITEDLYYKYFFINSKIMLYYLKNNKNKAIEYLKQLESLDTKDKYFFVDCENILEKRKGLIKEVLEREENLNQLELINFFLKDRMMGIEYYYCRPFLISDLQYVSI